MEDVKGLPIEIIIDRSGVVIESRNGYGYKKKWARKLERDLKAQLVEEQWDNSTVSTGLDFEVFIIKVYF